MAENQDDYRAARLARAIGQVYPRLADFPVYQTLQVERRDSLSALSSVALGKKLLISPPHSFQPRPEAQNYHQLLQEQRWADMLNRYFQAECRLKDYWETPYHAERQEGLWVQSYHIRKAKSAIHVMEYKLNVYASNMTQEDKEDNVLEQLVQFCTGILTCLHTEALSIEKSCQEGHERRGMKWYPSP